MTTFIIDTDNNITALTGMEAAAPANGSEAFASEKDLLRIAGLWPADRLVEVWNGIPGVKAVTRFTSRNAGAARVWKAIQGLAKPVAEAKPATAEQPLPKKADRKKAPKAPPAKDKGVKANKDAKASKPAKTAKGAKAAKPTVARDGSKKSQVVEMMRRKGGCTLAEIMKATGWQAHTVRGFISAAVGKKMGLTVTSTKSDAGERTYSLPQ